MQYSERTSQDLEELRELKGLQIKTVYDPSSIFKLKLSENSTKADIEMFLNSFPVEFEFEFFDFFHPQISDPGAYVTIQKSENDFLYQLCNHGWSTEWKRISKEDLIDYVFRNRDYNEMQCAIRRRTKAAVLGQRL